MWSFGRRAEGSREVLVDIARKLYGTMGWRDGALRIYVQGQQAVYARTNERGLPRRIWVRKSVDPDGSCTELVANMLRLHGLAYNRDDEWVPGRHVLFEVTG